MKVNIPNPNNAKYSRAIKKSPGDTTGAKPMSLKTISKPTHNSLDRKRGVSPTDWANTKQPGRQKRGPKPWGAWGRRTAMSGEMSNKSDRT